jgi:Flp pilus assembly protein TadG
MAMNLPWARRDDRGAVTLITSLMITFVVLPLAAMVVDVGGMYVEREDLQSGADAAAMKVAQACAAGGCGASDIAKQLASAKSYADANAKDGRTAVTEVCGNWGALPSCSTLSTTYSGCIGAPPSENYVEIRVATELADGSTLLPPTFAQTIVGNEGYAGSTLTSCSRVSSSSASVCVTAEKATYKHTFDGPAGKATITALRPLCPGESQPFALVSYTAPASSFAVPQYVYDSQVASITSDTPSLSFHVDVPPCFTQVDFVFGADIANPLTGVYYGDRKVGSGNAPGNTSSGSPAWYNGGSVGCNPKPAVTFTQQCDGIRVNLANGGSANVDAAFTVKAGSTSQFLRVANGGSTSVKILSTTATKVTVEDSSINAGTGTFNTTTGNWSKPKGC